MGVETAGVSPVGWLGHDSKGDREHVGEERCCTEESWDAAPLSLRGLFELFCDPGAALPGVLSGEPLFLSGERGDGMLVQFGFQCTKAKDGEENYQ